MDRYIIKGRGKHRGKYLCWALTAPEQKATEDGFVWLPEQRKAVRWEDPRHSGRTWATERAMVHNGYFVRLTGSKALTGDTIAKLHGYIAEHAAGASEELPCHWFGDDFHDAGKDFCRDCAEKLVDEKYAADPKRFENLYGECEDAEERYSAAIDGGFDTDHDSPPYCETCGAKLSGYLTEYGADQEIEALTDDCAPTFDDVDGWAKLGRAIINLSDDDPRWRRIVKVVEAGRVAEARVGLLSLLSAREAQRRAA